MKIALLIFFITIGTIASATDYYISSSGDDLNFNGTSSSTPWKTIAKVNSIFSTLKPGDRILFNRGDTLYGTLTPTKSGTIENAITIGAYGTGSRPVISGFTTINGWEKESGGIYSKVISPASAPNMVTVDGVNTPIGRYPNTSYLKIDSHVGGTSITDAELPASPAFTGGEVVIRKNHWIIDRCPITDHTNQTLTYTNTSTYSPANGYGYFVQNHLSTLTALGEWYYNPAAKKFYMYFGSVDPAIKTVKVCTLDELVNIRLCNYITFENITFEGANTNCFNIASSSGITIQNCTIGYAGKYGIYGLQSYGASSNGFTLLNSIVSNCNNCAIEIGSLFQNALLSNNVIHDIAVIPGMGMSGDGKYYAIRISGATGTIIEFNDVYNIGFVPISGNGSDTKIRNNYIHNYGYIKDDGGGINVAYSTYTGREITNNIIADGIGATDGAIGSSQTMGIYCDDMSGDILINGNSIFNITFLGLYLHNAHHITVTNNTIYNCYKQIYFNHDPSFPDYPIHNVIVNQNIFFSKAATQTIFHFTTSYEDLLSFGTADNNYYARPIADDNVFYTYTPSLGSKTRTLANWQSYSGQDLNSKKSPITITDVNVFRFEYNASKSNKVVTLDKPMIDVKGTKYHNSITLLPYTSAVLMVDPNPTPPEIPIYLSSVIENATPSLLEMTYSLPLANSVPAASSFSVVVNSVPRSVSAVSVSGGKVLLTLSSPVISGNVVTVAYTKPAVNPIKTTSGGEAASMGPQPVTNKVSSGIPLYLNSVVENLTPTMLEITFDLNLSESIIPSTSVFNVQVNSSTRTINNISILGNKVRLTLSNPVVYGDAITVSYTKPATGGLQTSLGGEVATFSTKTVTNNVGPVTPIFVSAVVENATPTIIEMNYNLSLANIIPATSAFSLIVNSSTRSIGSVSIVSGKVRLTLPSPLSYGDIITISYSKPSTNPLQTSSGGQAASISGKPVTNNINPAVPVYTSSAIEDATSDILEMTYNIALANIIPAISAFDVQVNSTSRAISSAAIVTGKVRLTLASKVVYGDIVTISYTIPPINPLQTSSGGQAESISLQPVTNKCFNPVIPNKLPVIDIRQNETEILSGFVYELDASATYDSDGDPLTYSWDVPAQFPVSSTTDLKIRYLTPVVSAPQTFNFTLTVNDTRDIVTKSISITVNPYKPELGIAKIDLIEASNYSFSDLPDNVNDGNLSTKWSIDGDNQWLTMRLTDPFKLDHVQIAFLPTQKYESYFDILASKDNILWEPILTRVPSCDFSGNLQNFDFSVEKNNISYSYIKLVGHGNSLNTMNNYSEIKLFGTIGEKSSDPAIQPDNISIYPNPATDFINVLVLEPPSETQLLRIFDYSGVLRFTASIEPAVNNLQIPLNLHPGAYVAQVLLGKIIVYAKQLIVQ
ncbi:MAG: right-handed parallel beta-helix repeat-containing protein [Bacteroidales bacterium]|nr:right-handed parallel beta-helix repeat-containing protein [Bacteroidales bacterium]